MSVHSRYPIKTLLVVFGLAVIIALVNVRLATVVGSGGVDPSTIQLDGQTIHVAVVDTPVARERGLSGRQGLAGDQGMLFVFPKDGVYSFWMKDMLFSIDIIWISADGTITDIVQNLSPDTYPTAYTPSKPGRYVLELPAGYVKAHNVHEGDIVRL